MKIYDGSSWNEAKDLKIYNPSGIWVPALKGWVFTGSGWIQHYPNFPFNYSAPVVQGSEAVGQIASVTNGFWTLDGAYAPSSYSYQWRRDYVNISGATSNQYTLVTADAGKTINAVVTATNQRGVTVQNSANSIIAKPANLSGLSLTDSTSTPSAPSTVSVSGGTNVWSASWTNTGASTYGVRTNNGGVSYSGGTSASGYSASAGSATVWVKSINTNGLVSVSWSASAGATQYNVNWTGGNNTTVYGTSTTISWPTGSSITVTVTPIVQVGGTGYGGGAQASSITPSQKESAETSGSTSAIVDPVYAPSYVSFTEGGFQGAVLTYPNSNSYSYPFYIVRPATTLSISSVSSNGTSPVSYSYQWQSNSGGGWYSVGSTSSSYTLPAGFSSAGYEYRCAVTATNSAGSATSYSSSTGAVVHVGGAAKAATGYWGNDVSPTGGTLYITEPSNSYGVGSSFENWNSSPTWGYDIYIYRSTTSGGTYTLHSSHVKVYNGGAGQTQTKTTIGWYYAVVFSYNGNSVNGNSVRIPSSGGFQLT
jgi:hypothetical protein